jgi:hypothetical protein
MLLSNFNYFHYSYVTQKFKSISYYNVERHYFYKNRCTYQTFSDTLAILKMYRKQRNNYIFSYI